MSSSGEGPRVWHGRGAKLDPRLAYLAGMSEQALTRMQVEERRALSAIAESLSRLLPPGEGSDEIARFHERRRELSARIFAPLTSGVHPPRPPAPEPRDMRDGIGEQVFSVFLDTDADAPFLASLGAIPRSRSAEVQTAFVPKSRLAALEASSAIRSIELARPWFYALDHAIPYAQIDAWHAEPQHLTGEGVIIGVIDNAIDIYHPAFRTPEGRTRLRFLWDQTLSPRAGERGPPTTPALPGFLPQGQVSYGVEYDAAAIGIELESALPAYRIVRHAPAERPQFAAPYHGTAVAGCAAGSPVEGRVGAAPGSSIIFVSPLGYDAGASLVADSASVLDACAYIFARADRAGRPCVINISMGDNQGPHDGTTQGERFLDDLLGVPGRAITISAGNASNTKAHASGRIAEGAREVLTLSYGHGAMQSDAVEIWYDGHDRFAVEVIPPQGQVIGPLQPGQEARDVAVGDVAVTVISVLNRPRNRDNQISIIINVPDGQQVPPGDWQIALTATRAVNGRFHAWIDRNNPDKAAWTSFLDERNVTLGTPGTARKPITVGNHTRATLPHHPAGISLGSGLGPTRDGRVKPEIAAIGTMVHSPYPCNRNDPTLQTTLFQSQDGTSMSAPIVAGACALLFEQFDRRGIRPTCAELKHILTEAAGTGGLARIPDSGFGFGFLQTRAAMAAPDPSVDVWLRKHEDDTGAEPFAGADLMASPDIEVLDADGNAPADPRHAPGRRFNAVIRVTARNRGAQTARNVTVYLYWADPEAPGTVPAAWQVGHIYAGPDFAEQTSRIVVPVLGPGAEQRVCFAWAPPDPAGSRHGDGHFRLLARVKQELDVAKRPISEAAFRASNNLALRDVRVLP